MVFSYYLGYLPYSIAWGIARLFRGKKLYVIHVEDAFDYFLFRKIAKYLAPLEVVVNSAKLIPQILELDSCLPSPRHSRTPAPRHCSIGMLRYSTPAPRHCSIGMLRYITLALQNSRTPAPPHPKIHLFPFCFPDGVIMFRNAAWKYPVKRIVKIGLEHGAYNFKRFPHAGYYNLFNLYLMTSFSDVKRLTALGAKSVKAIGYPKSDSLFDGSYTPQMLSKLRQDLNLDPQKTTLLFSSTWDGSQMSAIEKWYSKVDSLTGDYNVLVTLHPRMSDFYKNYFKHQANLCYIEAMDIYPYLLLADVCIGDTNSLIAEFCIVDKPIITFSIPSTKRTLDDVIELIKEISIRIDSFAELPLAIDTAVKTAKETSPIRKAVISTLIDPLDGKAGKRAATEITNLMPELKI